jgi:hypothetical protein
MHGACCVIDTASKWEIHLQNGFAMQKKIKNACCVNNTACTVIAVSLTPHAEYNTTCTIAFKWIIYQKRLCPRIVLQIPNLQGLPNKKCQ